MSICLHRGSSDDFLKFFTTFLVAELKEYKPYIANTVKAIFSLKTFSPNTHLLLPPLLNCLMSDV